MGSTEVIASKRTISIITTGGGFSKVQAQPAWQATAVAQYLASGATLPGSGNYNAAGRACKGDRAGGELGPSPCRRLPRMSLCAADPDVAAIGHNLFLYMNGQPSPGVDGTSASAPIFAAILALANNALYLAGKPPVGFVNPAIYAIAVSTPGAFNDINCAGCVNNCGTNGWCVSG